MKRYTYKIVLELLKLLVVMKRGVVHGVRAFRRFFWWLDTLVRNTIGYRLYTWQRKFDSIRKWTGRLRDGRIIEFFGERKTLELALIVVGLLMILPHTRVMSVDNPIVSGRKTVLFALAGPDEDLFSIEEIVVDRSTAIVPVDTRSWTEGAVVKNPSLGGTDMVPVGITREQLALVTDGRALVKPTLAPGSIIIPTPEEAAAEAEAERGSTRYIVQSGDVLGSIAEQFGVSVETILWANDLSYRSVIRPGQELLILSTTGVVHRVKSGDTLGRIARLYDAEIGDIIRENNLPSAGTIGIGQELVIPGGRRIAATPTPAPRPVVTAPTVQPTTPSAPSPPPPPSSVPASAAGYIWPTNVRTITQYYGWRHTGVDIAGPIGSPLYASRDGSVIKSQCGWNGGYGCYIIVDHGDGIHTLYAHASQLLVSVGERVVQGQTIALMGSTGRSTGPHIHFEVRVGGRRANPFTYVN